jgi:cell division protein FtsB
VAFVKAVEGWNAFVMSDPIYNEQIITRYLLGDLSEVETERLDALSITDDRFAAALSVAEKELVDSYVQGELNEGDLARFKNHYVASPLRRDRVDFARALQVFGESSAGRAVQPTALAGAKTGWLSSLFSNSRPIVQWGFALATLVLLLAGGLLLFQNVRLRQQINQTQARRDELQQREFELQKQLENQRTANASAEQELARIREERKRLEEQSRAGKIQPSPEAAVASLILTPQMRSGGLKTVTLSPTTERVAMQLELEPNDHSTYSVALIDQSGGQFLWRSGRIKAARAGDRKSLSVSFRAGLLRAGLYRMQVSGISPGGASEVVGEYPFRVSK